MINEFKYDRISCDEQEKELMMEQVEKLLNDPKMVGMDYYDCAPVFERDCIFKSQVFPLDEHIEEAAAKWFGSLDISSANNMVIWIDGDPSMKQFTDIISEMYDLAGINCDAAISYNGIALDNNQIRISVWY